MEKSKKENYSIYSLMGAHVQIKFLSPKASFTLAEDGQNLLLATQCNG